MFCLGRRDVSDRLQTAAVVEPVDPLEGRERDGFQGFPGHMPPNGLGFVKAVAVAVSDIPTRRCDQIRRDTKGVDRASGRDLGSPFAPINAESAVSSRTLLRSKPLLPSAGHVRLRAQTPSEPPSRGPWTQICFLSGLPRHHSVCDLEPPENLRRFRQDRNGFAPL